MVGRKLVRTVGGKMLTLLELLYCDFGRAIAYSTLCERIQYARKLGFVPQPNLVY
ncbi:hypothetical protein H6G74_30620 [Nostoc spongiaeforme FACHB-130]|uniref:Uncharacterized protein n=1 Tax=Nostoc spongiaeforme FACHB-130 TaxID=1357510 RepID=A0ABR8G610_9NOSO|nr:hypothetical protein [Nostoc spongiaeforme]MBD2598619.1 hypothetical protein [Nostoc spongiaeforme FACHB-130]